jgi:Coenzyme PQQ synthesis protein D (PqqD)
MKLDPQQYSQFFLDNGSIVLRQDAKQLFILNTTASQLWQAVMANQTIEAIAQAWTMQYGICQNQALQDIQSALAAWQTQGLLGTLPTAEVTKPVIADTPKPIAIPPYTYSQNYRIGLFDISIRCNTVEIADRIHQPLAAYSIATATAPHAYFHIFQSQQRYWLCLEDKLLWHGETIDTIINGLFYEILQVGVREINWLIALHAGAVSKNNTVIALSGIGGTGKSTLTAALLSHGFAYWGDDIILIEKNTLLAVPLPIPMTIKKGSWPLLAGYYPTLNSLPIYQRLGKQTRYLTIPKQFAASKKRLTHLVFSRVCATTPAQLCPITPLQALECILAANSSLSQPLDYSTANQLAIWLASIHSFELTYFDLEQGIAIIKRELL